MQFRSACKNSFISLINVNNRVLAFLDLGQDTRTLFCLTSRITLHSDRFTWRQAAQRSDRWCSDSSSVGVLTVRFVVSPCLKRSLEMFPPSAGHMKRGVCSTLMFCSWSWMFFYILCMTIITVLCSLCFNIAHKDKVIRLRSGSRGGHNPPPLSLSRKHHVNNAFVTSCRIFLMKKDF
jgi:hypothetical protein